MRGFILFVVNIFIYISCFSQSKYRQELDSIKMAKIDSAVAEKLNEVDTKLNGRQYFFTDILLNSIPDSLMKQHVALKIYNHYVASNLMGAETMVVYMVDNWFANGKIKMKSDIDLLNAKIFADFNRLSLIGLKAPVLALKDTIGNIISVPAKNEYSILYFYSPDCPKCRITTKFLIEILNEIKPSINIYFIYVGDNSELWHKYIDENFKFNFKGAKIYNLWDPNLDSGFRRKYGILQTPKMYLIDNKGNIIGKNLDPFALKKMIIQKTDIIPYNYGSKEADNYYNKIFSSIDSVLRYSDVYLVGEALKDNMRKTRDTLSYRHSVGNLLYYLMRKNSGSQCHKSAVYVADSLILNHRNIWGKDSLQIVGLAKFLHNLDNLLPINSIIPKMNLRGKMWTYNTERGSAWRNIYGRPSYIVFYSKKCNDCKLQLDKIRAMLSGVKERSYVTQKGNFSDIVSSRSISTDLDSTNYVSYINGNLHNIKAYNSDLDSVVCKKKSKSINIQDSKHISCSYDINEQLIEEQKQLRFFMVELSNIEKNNKKKFAALMSKFDLSKLPFIIKVDSQGRVIDKYILF